MLRTILVLCLAAAVFGDVNVEPPVSVRSGQNVKLFCGFSSSAGEGKPDSVKWWFRRGSEFKPLYQRLGAHRSKVEGIQIDLKDPESDTIEIPHMQPKDAGNYSCVVTPPLTSSAEEKVRLQQVFVYTTGTGPVLNVTKRAGADGSPDLVDITCEADDVAPYPDLVILIDGKEKELTSEIVADTQTYTFEVRVNTTLKADDVDGTVVRCELFYRDQQVKHEVFAVDRLYYTDESARLRSTTEQPRPHPPGSTAHTLTTTPQNSTSSAARCSWLLLLAVTIVAVAFQKNFV